MQTLHHAATGTGVAYQWQYASSCAGAFADIAGATSADFEPELRQRWPTQVLIKR